MHIVEGVAKQMKRFDKQLFQTELSSFETPPKKVHVYTVRRIADLVTFVHTEKMKCTV